MTMKENADFDVFDVIIVGSGPAGIACAHELITKDPNLKILQLEMGKDRLPDDKNKLYGWGGAGAFSDGKLTLSSQVGGQLVGGKGLLSANEFKILMDYAVDLFERFGGQQELKIGDEQKIAELVKRADAAGLTLIPYPIKHFGKEGAYRLIKRIKRFLKKRGVTIRLNSKVVSIEREGDKSVVVLKNGKRFYSDFLVLAPGRAMADWSAGELEKLGAKTEGNPADMGIRYEGKKTRFEELTDNLHDFKLKFTTLERGDEIRSFCVCPEGSVTMEEHTEEDPPYNIVNGETAKTTRTENTNFAILVSLPLDIPNPNAFGKCIARAANIIANGSVLVQTLADFHRKRRSYPPSLEGFSVKPTLPSAFPGDLRIPLGDRFTAAITEFLQAMDRFIPGVNEGNKALLYGIEVKYYSRKTAINKNCETDIPNVYSIGDGSGWTRGIVQSTVMAIIAARDIVKKVQSGARG